MRKIFLITLIILSLIVISLASLMAVYIYNNYGYTKNRNIQQYTNIQAQKNSCSESNGFLCSESSSETCEGSWIEAKDSKRCCSIPCSKQPICKINPETGKKNLCYCEPNENKNKVSVIIKKKGVYDNEEIKNSILAYFEGIKKDLRIQNAGITEFDGNSILELDKLVDSLYLNKDVAYIILIGDNLPVGDITEEDQTNLFAIESKLQYANREKIMDSCRDLGISYILPPVYYSNDEKIFFVKKLIDRYADYHNNPAYYFSQYKKAILRIEHDPKKTEIGAPLTFSKLNYALPVTEVFNSAHEDVRAKFKEKYLVAKFDVHGAENFVGLGINYRNLPENDYYAFYTTLEDYSNFVKENGQPFLFIDSGACQATTIKYKNIRYCCWPQILLESGAWTYYLIGGSSDMEKAITNGKPIGYNIRKILNQQNIIFGDILAYFPG